MNFGHAAFLLQPIQYNFEFKSSLEAMFFSDTEIHIFSNNFYIVESNIS